MGKRWQKNITISEYQVEMIKLSRSGKLHKSLSQLSKELKLPINKLHNNMRLLGLVNPRNKTVIKISENTFDVDSFGKLYQY